MTTTREPVRTRLGVFRWEQDAYALEHPTLGVSVVIVAEASELDACVADHPWCLDRADTVVAEAKQLAAREGLDVHNAGYRDAAAPLLTHDAFAARLKLSSIELEEETSRLFFDDDDLFWGHTVWVVCDRDGTPRTTGFSG